MFKHRFLCTDKERFVSEIEYKMLHDKPIASTRFCDFYGQGIHFHENGERIKGEFLYCDHLPSGGRGGGEPPKAKFNGKFIEEDGQLFFEVYIYPPIWVALILILLIVGWVPTGRWDALVIATLAVCIFGRQYYRAMKQAAQAFERMII